MGQFTSGGKCDNSGADPGKLQGEGHESKWGPYLYPKLKNSTDFGHLILVVPYFQFFFCFFYILYFFRPVVPLGPGRPVVSLLGRRRPLTGLWCPWKDCGAPDKPEMPTTGPWCS